MMVDFEKIDACVTRIQSQRVLVVDDDEVCCNMIQMFVNKCGLACDGANTGEIAMRLVSENDYNLILLDLRMPGMDGVEFITECHRKGIEVPIVVTTGLRAGPLIEGAEAAGIAHFLYKPITLELVEKTLRQFNLIGYGSSRR